MADNSVPTLADVQQAKLDMDDINTFVGSSADSFTDNGGNNRLTVAGIINTAIINAGYVDRGTFSAGATLTQPNEVLQHSGEFYRWSGAFDKVVTAGSTPTPAGVGGWIAVGDATLRAALAALGSTALIAGVQARAFRAIDGVKNLIPVENVMLNVASFYAGGDTGGGDFYYDPSANKANHNGGTIIAPEAVSAWDGTATNLSTLLNWTGTGSGCYVRPESLQKYQVESFGGLRSPELCTEAMQKLLDTYGVMKGVPDVEYKIRRVWFNRPVYIDLNRCTVRGDVFTTSGFRGDGINGIQIINGTMLHTKTLGVYVQAVTLNNCQNVLLEDLLIDGFSQFSINMNHTIDGEYSGFTLRRVKVHNAGNFLADASAIANCLEFFNRDTDSIRTDTIIEDCEFFLMDGAKGNIVKLGVCRDTHIKRTRFKCIDRTAVGSSGIQSGATGNPYNNLNKVTLEDCNIHCVNTLDGYYAYDGVGSNRFVRSSITGDGGSIYNPPKGTAAQEWIFEDSSIVGLFLYDNPINTIGKIHLKNSYVYRFKLEKDESVVDPTACVVSKFIMDNSQVDQLNFNCTMPSIKVFGAESYVPYLGLAVADVDIGTMEFSDRAVIGDLVYTTTNGSVEKIVIDNAVLKKISLRDNSLNHLLIKNSELHIGGGFEWYVNGLLSCNVLNNVIIPNPDLAPTTATNLLSFYSNGNCNGNTFDNIPNRSFYITAANCFVKAVNNIYNKSNYAPYATIGSGEVRNYNCIMNEILMPFNFRSLPQSIASTPVAHGQYALSGGKWYQAIGTTNSTDWKQTTN